MSFDLTKDLTKRVLMITGPESMLRKRVLDEIVAASTEADDFDFESFTADERPVQDWLAAASTVPFLSERRTVVVRQLLRAGDPEDVGLRGKSPFDTLPSTALLVLVADEESGDENRQRRLQTVSKAWAKIVAATGKVVECKADEKNLVAMVREEAKRLNKSLSMAAAETLLEMVGRNVSRAFEEMEKLVLYVGDAPEIRESDVRAVASSSREWNVYKIADAVFTGNAGEAIRQLRMLVGSSTRAEEAAFRTILPTMTRQLRLVWQARVCLDAGTTPERAPAEVRGTFPERPNLAKEADWTRSRAMRSAKSLSLEQIAQCLRELADADARLKGLIAGFSAIETLEVMLLRMVDIVRPAPVDLAAR